MHNTGKSLGSEMHTPFTLRMFVIMEVSPVIKKGCPYFFTLMLCVSSLVIEDMGGLPVAGNRGWRDNSIFGSKFLHWMGGATEFVKAMGENSLQSYNRR